MGCASSAEAQVKEETQTPLEARAMGAVLARATEFRASGQVPKTFEAAAMRFPTARANFRSVRGCFKEHAEGEGPLHGWSLRFDVCRNKVLPSIGMHLAAEEEAEVIATADMDGSKALSFREFLIILCLGHLVGGLDVGYESDVEGLDVKTAVAGMMDTVVQCWALFDADNDGYITRAEAEAVFSRAGAEARGAVGQSRFDEMDWDHSGRISFVEFLYAFEGWIGVDDDELYEGLGEPLLLRSNSERLRVQPLEAE